MCYNSLCDSFLKILSRDKAYDLISCFDFTYISQEHYEVIETMDDGSQETASTSYDPANYKLLDDNMDAMGQTSPHGANLGHDDRTIFELQLTQLQEQLMTVMIENQSLRELLRQIIPKVTFSFFSVGQVFSHIGQTSYRLCYHGQSCPEFLEGMIKRIK